MRPKRASLRRRRRCRPQKASSYAGRSSGCSHGSPVGWRGIPPQGCTSLRSNRRTLLHTFPHSSRAPCPRTPVLGSLSLRAIRHGMGSLANRLAARRCRHTTVGLATESSCSRSGVTLSVHGELGPIGKPREPGRMNQTVAQQPLGIRPKSRGGEYGPRKVPAASPPCAHMWSTELCLLLLRGLDLVLLPGLGRFHLGHFRGLHLRAFRRFRLLRSRRLRRSRPRRRGGAFRLSDRCYRAKGQRRAEQDRHQFLHFVTSNGIISSSETIDGRPDEPALNWQLKAVHSRVLLPRNPPRGARFL